MKTFNKFFFDEERIHASDAIWFYGGMSVFITIFLVVML